jgi:hypothetical protein
MRLILFILNHFIALMILVFLSYVFGRRLTRTAPYVSVWEEIAFCIPLGLGAIAYLIFLLGVTGLLYRTAIFSLLFLLQLICYPVWRDLAQRSIAAIKGGHLRLVTMVKTVLSVTVLTPILLLSLKPPTAFDAIMYHLAYAKIYAQNHHLVLTPYLRYAVSPQLNEMLFTLALICYDDIEAQLVQCLMMILVAVALYAWGQRVFSSRVGLWAAVFWLATSLVLRLGSTAYIDIGLTLFVSLAIYAMFNWLSTKKTFWLVTAGVYTGFAAGSKYSALFFLLALSLISLYRRVIEHRFAPLAIFTAVAVVVASPWYLRNLSLTGNPVFPFLPSIFGYFLWNAGDLSGQLLDWKMSGITGGTFLEQFRPLAFPVFWILPLAVFFGVRRSYNRRLLALALVYVLFWLCTASLPRYLLPILPILSLATAASCAQFVYAKPRLHGWLGNTSTAVLGFMLLMYPNWRYAAREEMTKGLAVDRQKRDEYLARELVAYNAYKYLNAERGTNYRLYALYDENMAYFADGTFMGDWFGPARYSQILSNLDNGQSLFRSLKRLNADYFLVATNRFPVKLPDDEYFQEHFKLVWVEPFAMLFELRNDPGLPSHPVDFGVPLQESEAR